MNSIPRPSRDSAGMTLLEVLVTTTILGIVLLVVTGIFLSSTRLQSKTARRSEIQMSSQQGLALMSTEIRQAGADPAEPPIGLAAIVSARVDLVRVRADLNGDGVLQTAEPSEDVTYSFDSATRSILRNPGSGAEVLVPNVDSLAFTYLDEANLPLTPLPLSTADAARVRAIEITLTAEDRDSRPVTHTTRVALRNL